MKLNNVMIGAGALALVAAAVLIAKKGLAGAAAGVVGAVGDAAAGTVVGIGQLFGLPATDVSRCAAAKASGSLLEASLYCPAGEFAAYGFNGFGTAMDGFVSAPVYAAGDALGVPRTNETECQRAKREGRTWDASFACPAGDFLSYLFH